MIRQQLNLDQLPTAVTIPSYSEHLQAETEEMTLSVPAKATSAVKAAALGVSPPPGILQNLQNESEQKFPNPKKRLVSFGWVKKGVHSRRECPLKAAGPTDSKRDPTKRPWKVWEGLGGK